jgi:Fe-S cluster biogenesis protein NfuA
METTIMNTDALISRVEKALDTIRPYMETDGGNIQLIEITSNFVAKVKLVGNCGSCPMSSMTMKAGVEEAIKKEVPEILAVESIN